MAVPSRWEADATAGAKIAAAITPKTTKAGIRPFLTTRLIIDPSGCGSKLTADVSGTQTGGAKRAPSKRVRSTPPRDHGRCNHGPPLLSSRRLPIVVTDLT